MLASVSVLAACDALGGELEQYVGGVAAGDCNLMRFVDGDAVTNDFGSHRVDVGRANFEAGRQENATFGGRIGDAAVNGQTGVGREADDDRGRDVAHDLLRSRFRGHYLRGDGGSRGGLGASLDAGRGATIVQAGEQAAVAALRAASDFGASDSGGATMETMDYTCRAAGGAASDLGAAGAACRDGGASFCAAVAEVNRIRASR